MKEKLEFQEAEIDQSELLEKYDTEARFRKLDRNTIPGLIVFIVCVGLSLFHLYTAWQGALVTLMQRAVHTSIILALVFILYPFSSKSRKDRPTVLDWGFSILSLALGAYIVFGYNSIVLRAGMPNQTDVILGLLAIITVLEGARRIVGKEIVILALIFLAYAYLGPKLPGMMAHRGYNIKQIAEYMYLSTEGIFGIAIGVSSSYIFLFILFGSFLQSSGMGQFFNDLSMAIAGSTKGGPAKVAVVSSGFLGSINGSAVANVVTTGAFTIPLMKKIGYEDEFAGAVEAAASCGGQILPPVMGAAAFIMAEYLGIPYIKIAISAIIPALLYYLGVIVMIHLRASKNGLEGLPKSQLPKVSEVLKERGFLLVPLIVLVYMLVSGKTPIYAAFFSILMTIGLQVVVRIAKKETKGLFMDIVNSLESGARTALGVAMSCAVVGIIIGVATLTGFGLKLAGAILFLGNGVLILTLFFTMIACIVLGMGLPSIPAYIITATMAAPALAKMGVPPLVSHMFVFYFGMLANLTPPVALAAFAGAGIAGGNPAKTGFQAVKLALAGFVVPYIFAFSPALLMVDASPLIIAIAAVTAVIGVVSLGAAVEGYMLEKLNAVYRIGLFASSVLLMIPGVPTDIIGLLIFLGIVTAQKVTKGKLVEA
ncbi:TRAP transporter, 4TM/12TM fusion protein [Dethiosulfatibacter aminovorans DSM 17477]|uniref:TRAP transporter, 4TM/12TM fusion protein n=1 Tax=Dethiosulfatibacter aminovorans DSM 17477 TaxID=1121476 RepID=A0A1M6IZM5_9FIRM|nr:TRAP transporter permease [Dethiosulfatibacter aminovorans]SHJ39948.1 TRAP transporter, 4TM/12TM fusion protein [Dethiosulfatibacter aminovorans DSM 17477]